MAERSYKERRLSERGAATMYVISENGLQTGPFIYSKTTDSRVCLDSSVFFGRKLRISRTKWTDVPWNAGSDNKVRTLNLNRFVDVCLQKRGLFVDARPVAGASNQQEWYNRWIQHSQERKHNINHRIYNLGCVSYRGALSKLEKSEDETNENSPQDALHEVRQNKLYLHKWFIESHKLPHSCHPDKPVQRKSANSPTDTWAIASESKDRSTASQIHGKQRAVEVGFLRRVFYPKIGNYHPTTGSPKRLLKMAKEEKRTAEQPRQDGRRGTNETAEEDRRVRKERGQPLASLRITFQKNSQRQKHILQSITKLPTLLNHKSGRQVNLTLKDVSFEQSYYNQWSRKEKRIRNKHLKVSDFVFPLISKSTVA